MSLHVKHISCKRVIFLPHIVQDLVIFGILGLKKFEARRNNRFSMSSTRRMRAKHEFMQLDQYFIFSALIIIIIIGMIGMEEKIFMYKGKFINSVNVVVDSK